MRHIYIFGKKGGGGGREREINKAACSARGRTSVLACMQAPESLVVRRVPTSSSSSSTMQHPLAGATCVALPNVGMCPQLSCALTFMYLQQVSRNNFWCVLCLSFHTPPPPLLSFCLSFSWFGHPFSCHCIVCTSWTGKKRRGGGGWEAFCLNRIYNCRVCV